jgi:AGZA family xanthine/uracil permease-like MFS transporter
VGLTHAYQLVGNSVDFHFLASSPVENSLPFRAYGIAIGYLLFAAVFFVFGKLHEKAGRPTDSGIGHR